MKRILLLILSAAILSGCSCPKQLERLRRHCPECFDSTTGNVNVDVPIPERLANFTIPLDAFDGDRPVVFTSPDNITLTLHIDGDDLAAQVTVPPDTVQLEVPVTLPCPQCPTCSTLSDTIKQILALLALILFFAWATAHTIREIRKERNQQEVSNPQNP